MDYFKKVPVGTFIVLIAFFCFLPPACAGTDGNTTTTNSTVPSFEDNTDYVIRNMETGLFLRCSSKGDKLVQYAAYFGSIGETDYEYYLWQFKPLVGGDTLSIIRVNRDILLTMQPHPHIVARPMTPALPGMLPLILITRLATS